MARIVLKLIIEDDEGRKTVVPFVRDEITVGRQEGNTIRLTERNVSRRHARLLRHNGAILLEDLGSYNGVRVNGDRVAGQAALHHGDLIQIGDYDLAVQQEADRPAAPPHGVQVLGNGSPAHANGTPNHQAPEADTELRATVRADARGRRRSTSIIRLREHEPARPQLARDLGVDEAPRLV